MQMLAALVTLKVHVTILVTTTMTVVSSQEPIIQMTALMHHFSTPRTGMRNPNQCSILCLKCQFTPPAFCQFMVYYNHTIVLGNNGHTRRAYTPTCMG